MALYQITIAGAAPLWPDLAALSGRTFARRDTACNGLWRAMYEAFQGDAALDTLRAHAALAWLDDVQARGLRKAGTIATHETARFSFTIERQQ